MNIELTSDITTPDRDLLRKIYEESFPESEQRPWEMIGSPDHKGSPMLFAILADGHLAGLATLWTFDRFAYIEHLAIHPDFRAKGIGSEVVKQLIEKVDPLPVVVEIEPPIPSDPVTIRRAEFYSRLGFVTIDRNYIQPPYASGLPSVHLHLLATTPLPSTSTTLTLHKEVYNIL